MCRGSSLDLKSTSHCPVVITQWVEVLTKKKAHTLTHIQLMLQLDSNSRAYSVIHFGCRALLVKRGYCLTNGAKYCMDEVDYSLTVVQQENIRGNLPQPPKPCQTYRTAFEKLDDMPIDLITMVPCNVRNRKYIQHKS